MRMNSKSRKTKTEQLFRSVQMFYLYLGFNKISDYRPKNVFKKCFLHAWCEIVKWIQIISYCVGMGLPAYAISAAIIQGNKTSDVLAIDLTIFLGIFVYSSCGFIKLMLLYYKSKEIKNYLKKINDFQSFYQLKTGKQIKSMNKFFLNTVMYTGLIMSLIIALVNGWYAKNIPIDNKFRFFMSMKPIIIVDELLKINILVLWFTVCKTIEFSGKKLRGNFRTDLNACFSENRSKVYQMLWWKLVGLTNDVKNVLGSIVFFNLVQELSVLYVNSCISAILVVYINEKTEDDSYRIIEKWSTDYYFAYYEPFMNAYGLLRIYIFAITAHQAILQVNITFFLSV